MIETEHLKNEESNNCSLRQRRKIDKLKISWWKSWDM